MALNQHLLRAQAKGLFRLFSDLPGSGAPCRTMLGDAPRLRKCWGI